MQQVTTSDLTELLGEHESPCISLYQPTHRHHPENQQDPIRYRNLVAEVESSLRQKYPTREVRSLIEKFEALSHDSRFWNHRTDGLAIFSSGDLFRVFSLQRSVTELLVVADSFHTKPLLRILQSADRFHILAVNRHEAKLFEGNRYALDQVELTQFPVNIKDALGDQLTEQHRTVASYGAGAARAAGGGATPSIHAHGDKADEVDSDRDRFFRVVDRGVLEHHSRPSGLPLMLAALTEYHQPFHTISHNPHLLSEGIQSHPDSLSLDQLRQEAWKVLEPVYLNRLAKLSDDYQVARSRDLGSEELATIAKAAVAGRVGTFLVEDNRQIPGKIDPDTGEIQLGELFDPEVDDLLDDLAELVLRMKGEVVVVPTERMPSKTGAVAMFRF